MMAKIVGVLKSKILGAKLSVMSRAISLDPSNLRAKYFHACQGPLCWVYLNLGQGVIGNVVPCETKQFKFQKKENND